VGKSYSVNPKHPPHFLTLLTVFFLVISFTFNINVIVNAQEIADPPAVDPPQEEALPPSPDEENPPVEESPAPSEEDVPSLDQYSR
jgi:hypothetical protein